MVVDKITSVLDPLLDFIPSLVEERVDAFAYILDVLFRDAEHGLRVVWGNCKCHRDEGEEG